VKVVDCVDRVPPKVRGAEEIEPPAGSEINAQAVERWSVVDSDERGQV
jgi:hypothetical protein